MFKILFLLLLVYLAYKAIRAGRFVRGVMRNVEEMMAAAQEPPPRPGNTADTRSGPNVTVHRKPGAKGHSAEMEAEDARFEDI